VRDSIDLVKLDGNHLGKEGFVSVVHHTTPLNDIHRRVFHESFSSPPRVVWMWEVVTVEDCNDICASVELEKVIEVVGFGLRAWDIGDSELWVLFFHLCQFRLERFDWLWCVVN
jgi:hypothetical protein